MYKIVISPVLLRSHFVIQKLREKTNAYLDEGCVVKFSEKPFAVVVLTLLMKRAHDIEFARHIVFCDSTSSCDADQHSITFFLTPCPAGAVPLGIVITKGQTDESYYSGFTLFKNTLSEAVGSHAFGHQGYPDIFLTDNCSAEIKALKMVWPKSENQLCKFHVLQAVWRWLCDSKNGISSDIRQAVSYTHLTLPTIYSV